MKAIRAVLSFMSVAALSQSLVFADSQSVRTVMSDGKWKNGIQLIQPFLWRTPDGLAYRAQNSGLEGFYYSKILAEYQFPEETFRHHYDDYFGYADYMMSLAPDFAQDRQALGLLRADKSGEKRNGNFNRLLKNTLAKYRAAFDSSNQASWIKKARIYQIFPRAYNVKGRRGGKARNEKFFRDFTQSDFKVIKDMGFDTVWTMGIFPVGERMRSGTGGGSVYSVRDHSTVNPDLGTEDDFKHFVEMAHKENIRVIIDFVANHTSMDSTLLDENPAYFISTPASGPEPAKAPPGYFYYDWHGTPYWVHYGGYDCGGGNVCTWNDTAQLDYSRPELRIRIADIMKSWVGRFDIDGFRVDMAYQDLNSMFRNNWGKQMPQEEFFPAFIASVRTMKPSAGFIAEAYSNQEELSANAFDLFYNKSEWGRLDGQTGWYDALASGNTIDVNAAVSRAAFLSWQKLGAGGLAFFGNHDEPSPDRVYGARLPAVVAMTFLQPGAALMYNGAEIGFDNAMTGGEQKTIPFSIPVRIDWQGGSTADKVMYEKIFKEVRDVRAGLGDYYIFPLFPQNGQTWSGFMMISLSHPGTGRAVIANVSRERTSVTLNDRRFGVRFHASLRPGEYMITDTAKIRSEEGL